METRTILGGESLPFFFHFKIDSCTDFFCPATFYRHLGSNHYLGSGWEEANPNKIDQLICIFFSLFLFASCFGFPMYLI